MKAEDYIEIVKVGGFDQTEYVGISDAKEAVKFGHNDAVKKWTLWCFNYSTPFESTICKIWGGTLSGFGTGCSCRFQKGDRYMKRLAIYLRPYLGRIGLGFTIKFMGTLLDLMIPWMLSTISVARRSMVEGISLTCLIINRMRSTRISNSVMLGRAAALVNTVLIFE